jgi:predicted aldo/keto reductase-like oxidoreductase
MTRRTYRKLKTKKNTVNCENPNGTASLCNKCGECVKKCPQNIQIPEELEQVKREMGKRKAVLW